MKQTKLAPPTKYKRGDLRNKFKVGDLITKKYRWPGEPKPDYVFQVTSFPIPKGKILYAKLVKVKEDGKWIRRGDPGDHFNWGESAFWDFDFRIGPITPYKGTGRAKKYTGAK